MWKINTLVENTHDEYYKYYRFSGKEFLLTSHQMISISFRVGASRRLQKVSFFSFSQFNSFRHTCKDEASRSQSSRANMPCRKQTTGINDAALSNFIVNDDRQHRRCICISASGNHFNSTRTIRALEGLCLKNNV